MTTFNIMLSSINDVKNFVNIVNRPVSSITNYTSSCYFTYCFLEPDSWCDTNSLWCIRNSWQLFRKRFSHITVFCHCHADGSYEHCHLLCKGKCNFQVCNRGRQVANGYGISHDYIHELRDTSNVCLYHVLLHNRQKPGGMVFPGIYDCYLSSDCISYL